MNEFDLSLMDGGMVALVMALVNGVKKQVPARWWPLLPFAAGWLVSIPLELVAGEGRTTSAMVNNIFMQGTKWAALSMAAYKVHRTTIKGVDVQKPVLKPVLSTE